jgi:hypothetical protein
MTNKCRLRIARKDFDAVTTHLFPDDGDEHGAVLLAGVSQAEEQHTLHVREVHLAEEGVDYVQGKIGYRALTPKLLSIASSRVLATSGSPTWLFIITEAIGK